MPSRAFHRPHPPVWFLAGSVVLGGTVNKPDMWPWFGGHDDTTPSWSYPDGTVFRTGTKGGMAVGGMYTNWASASPGDASGTYCTTLSHSGTLTWVDRGCAEVHPRLCERY